MDSFYTSKQTINKRVNRNRSFLQLYFCDFAFRCVRSNIGDFEDYFVFAVADEDF